MAHGERRMKTCDRSSGGDRDARPLGGTAAGTVIERGLLGRRLVHRRQLRLYPRSRGEFYGHFRLRADKGGEAFYGLDKFWHRDVYTNPDTEGGSSSAATGSPVKSRRRWSVGTSMSSRPSRPVNRS